LEQRRLPRAVRPDQRDPLPALDQHVGAVVDAHLAEALARALELDDRAPAARRLGEADPERALVAVGRRQAVHLLELLHAALHQRGFGGLVAEAVDERVDAPDLGLLVLVGLAGLCEALLALGQVPAVVRRVVGYSAV